MGLKEIMPSPADSDDVISALRLGWYVAEVRGRNRPDAPRPEIGVPATGQDHFLPLRNERRGEDLRTEAQVVMSALAVRFAVDTDQHGGSYSGEIASLAGALPLATGHTEERPSRWDDLAAKIFEFDAHIQDTLTSKSDSQANAYLLGRGLSESYWALDPRAEDGSPTSWSSILGAQRCTELSRGIGRLAAYFTTYTAPAIGGSLSAWHEVASDADWRSRPDALPQLYLQIRRWYELLVLGQDPSTLVKPYAILKSRRGIHYAVRTFGVQMVIFGLSVGVLVGLVFFATNGSKSSAGINTIVALASAAGITTATLQAKLKNSSQATLARLRQDVYSDLVAGEITYLPIKPGFEPKNMLEIIASATQQRSLTTAVSV
ncbi:MAG: hypothetical protein WB765_18230 [Acidimicrobiales bacterium]